MRCRVCPAERSRLIIGIYERFIDSLSTMVRSPLLLGDADGRDQIKRALMFLVPLGIGIVIAYYLATKLLVGPEDKPGVLRRSDTAPMCYAFFFGLVLLSVREPWRRIKSRNATHWVAAIAGFGTAAAFASMPHGGTETATWMLALGGAGAISIMLLPGVSGSLFLVIIGQYNTIAPGGARPRVRHDRRVPGRHRHRGGDVRSDPAAVTATRARRNDVGSHRAHGRFAVRTVALERQTTNQSRAR